MYISSRKSRSYWSTCIPCSAIFEPNKTRKHVHIDVTLEPNIILVAEKSRWHLRCLKNRWPNQSLWGSIKHPLVKLKCQGPGALIILTWMKHKVVKTPHINNKTPGWLWHLNHGSSPRDLGLTPLKTYMGVSKNRGTPKSSILIGFSIINHPFWGTPIFGNTHMETPKSWRFGSDDFPFQTGDGGFGFQPLMEPRDFHLQIHPTSDLQSMPRLLKGCASTGIAGVAHQTNTHDGSMGLVYNIYIYIHTYIYQINQPNVIYHTWILWDTYLKGGDVIATILWSKLYSNSPTNKNVSFRGEIINWIYKPSSLVVAWTSFVTLETGTVFGGSYMFWWDCTCILGKLKKERTPLSTYIQKIHIYYGNCGTPQDRSATIPHSQFQFPIKKAAICPKELVSWMLWKSSVTAVEVGSVSHD